MAGEVKFGDWISKGFELFKQNMGTLILAALLTILLSAVTMGILAGPMMVGFILIVLGLLDGKEPKPAVGDVFQGFGYFADSFLFYLVWGLATFVGSIVLGIIPCIGSLIASALSLVLWAFLMFGIFLIADRKMAFWPASMESINAVKPQLLPLLGLSVVANLIASVGVVLCFVGIFVTMPIGVCILAVAYREYMTPAAPEAPAPTA